MPRQKHGYLFFAVLIVVAAIGVWALWQGVSAGQATKLAVKGAVKPLISKLPLASDSKGIAIGGSRVGKVSQCRPLKKATDPCDGRLTRRGSEWLCCPASCGDGVIDVGEMCDDAAPGCFPGEVCFGCGCWPLGQQGGQTSPPPGIPPPQGMIG